VPKPNWIELPTGETIPILYEDRAVIAIDKPRGWMLVPFRWQRTARNLAAALASSIAAGDFWARSRNLKFLRHIHRLDADTTGILLLARSPGALRSYSGLFESRKMDKVYLAVVRGAPREREWICRLGLAPDPRQHGKMKIDARLGKAAETRFRLLETAGTSSLLEAHPYTGRTHQIRLHLSAAGLPVLGDDLYGPSPGGEQPLGLRAVSLSYSDPFTRRPIRIRAPAVAFCREFGFAVPAEY
jgi:23S rRNA pseudouridine1911/1915/1917 synthase